MLIERLVGTFGVELLPETLELTLLCPAGVSRRSRGLGFQRAMHTLMTPVLLRLSWLDELGHDAEAHPPG